MKRTDFLKLGLGVALTPLVKVLPADAQPLDVIADEPLPAKPVTDWCYSASSSATSADITKFLLLNASTGVGVYVTSSA